MSDYYLPQQTARLLTPTRLQQCKNARLLLDKYPPQSAVANNDEKGKWLAGFESDNHIDEQLVASVTTRWSNMLQTLHAQAFTAPTAWRMVVGLGGNSVLETDLTLHHLYGIPFIPGSALKGLTRAYVTGQVEGHKSKKLEDDDKDVRHIFGMQENSGSVIFFDAMPLDEKIGLKLDIMNAHYPKYYGEQRLPTNTQDPNPVTFLTVTSTTFLFAVAPRRPANEKDKVDAEQALKWLQAALQNYGVGGKTSAGYGYFQQFSSQALDAAASQETNSAPAPIVDPEIARVESLKAGLDAMRLPDVANQINGYYQQWRALTLPTAKRVLAEAIIEKVKKAGRERQSAEKAWYKDLQTFLAQEG